MVSLFYECVVFLLHISVESGRDQGGHIESVAHLGAPTADVALTLKAPLDGSPKFPPFRSRVLFDIEALLGRLMQSDKGIFPYPVAWRIRLAFSRHGRNAA